MDHRETLRLIAARYRNDATDAGDEAVQRLADRNAALIDLIAEEAPDETVLEVIGLVHRHKNLGALS